MKGLIIRPLSALIQSRLFLFVGGRKMYFYQMTEYPKLFENVYWGRFTYGAYLWSAFFLMGVMLVLS